MPLPSPIAYSLHVYVRRYLVDAYTCVRHVIEVREDGTHFVADGPIGTGKTLYRDLAQHVVEREALGYPYGWNADGSTGVDWFAYRVLPDERSAHAGWGRLESPPLPVVVTPATARKATGTA